MRTEPTKRLLESLAITAALTNTELSAPAARVMAADLARYPEDQVIGALERCRRELHTRMCIADVISRLEDGRPGPEEAWSLIPTDEDSSVVWSDEMRESMGVAQKLISAGELIPARMAFLEHYRKAVALARDAGKPVVWSFSPGFSKDGRELALQDALRKGRISLDWVKVLLPYHRDEPELHAHLLALSGAVTPRPKALNEKTVDDEIAPPPAASGWPKLGEKIRERTS